MAQVCFYNHMIFLVRFGIVNFLDYKLHFGYRLVQFGSPLNNLLVLIYLNLYSTLCDYLFKQPL